MPTDPNYRLSSSHAFLGDAVALAEEANRAAEALGVGDPDPAITERQVRDYVQRGILSKPERRGREALYTFHHLAQLLAAKALLRDGWKLAKIADFMETAALDDLLRLAAPGESNTALAAAQAIRAERQLEAPSPWRRRWGGVSGSLSKPPTMLDVASTAQIRLTELRAELPTLLQQIGGDPAPDAVDALDITLTPDIRLTVSRDRLKRLTLHEIELIGRAVAASLATLAAKGD